MKFEFLSLAVLISAIIAIIYRRRENTRIYSVFKLLTTVLIILIALIIFKKTSSIYSAMVIAALFFSLAGDVFLINRLATSRIACPTEMETENKLLQALDAAELYRIEGDLFELVDQHNKTKARFRAGP